MKTLAALLLLATACGHDGLSSSSCTWPAQFDETDAGSAGACVAGLYWLSCNVNNDGEDCLSTDKTTCPPSGVAGTVSDCKSQCRDDEYALLCGFGSASAQPPATCRGIGGLPGGTSISCCPCGS